MSGEITKEAVSLMRRAAEITGNEEIKFAAAHIQSEFDKKHPRQLQVPLKKDPEKSRFDYPIKKQLPRSISAPDVSSHKAKEIKKRTEGPNRVGLIQSQLPRKRWTPTTSQFYRPPQIRAPRNTPESTPSLPLTREEAARLQSLADRTKNPELKELSRKLQHLVLAEAHKPIHSSRILAAESPKSETLATKPEPKEEDVAKYAGLAVDLNPPESLPAVKTELLTDAQGSVTQQSISSTEVTFIPENTDQTATPFIQEKTEFFERKETENAVDPLAAGVSAC